MFSAEKRRQRVPLSPNQTILLSFLFAFLCVCVSPYMDDITLNIVFAVVLMVLIV